MLCKRKRGRMICERKKKIFSFSFLFFFFLVPVIWSWEENNNNNNDKNRKNIIIMHITPNWHNIINCDNNK